MKKTKKHSKIFTIALITILSITGIIAILPTVLAHDPAWTVPTYAYLGLQKNPVGVGEPAGMIMWIDKTPPTAGGLGGDRWRSHTVTVEKPDGSIVTLGPFDSDPIGTRYLTYTPDQVGTYYLQSHFGGQTALENAEDLFPGGSGETRGLIWVGDYFEPSDSEIVELIVTEEPQPGYENYPLPGPNDYWDRPLQGDIKDWNTYASNWLGGDQLVGGFQPYGAAPNSPHIMWVKPLRSGGIVGDIHGDQPYGPDDYESPWDGAIIMNGIVYYNNPAYPKAGYYAIELRTGEELWFQNVSSEIPYSLTTGGFDYNAPRLSQTYAGLSFGWNYHYTSLNGQGILDFLWTESGDTWHMIDPNNGDWVMALTNVPGGDTITSQKDGDIQMYDYSDSTGVIEVWSLTTGIPRTGPIGSNALQWRPRVGAFVDAVSDTSWTEYPLPTYRPGSSGNIWTAEDVLPRSGYLPEINAPADLGDIQQIFEDELILFSTDFPSRVRTTDTQPETVKFSAVSLKPSTKGQLLWTETWTVPPGNNSLGFGIASIEDRIFTVSNKERIMFYGFDLDSGTKIYETEKQADWNMFGQETVYAYNTIYVAGYAGHLYAYDAATGTLKWDYFAENIGGECPYGQYPLEVGAIADGKVYLYSDEHSPTKPLWRGSRLRCLDAFEGEELWTTLHWSRGGIGIADGYLISANRYDDQIYCFGRGPSATTVTAPDTAVFLGSSVMIRGTVTDQSAGAKGTPAIADEYMGEWMEYLYQNKAMPDVVVGVTVKLSVYDPNGNYQDIGTTTVDAYGNFGKSWTPSVEGEYYIQATFEGSESYGSSSATTYLGVAEALQGMLPSESTPASQTDTYVAGSAIAVIAAIAIVGFLILRKK